MSYTSNIISWFYGSPEEPNNPKKNNISDKCSSFMPGPARNAPLANKDSPISSLTPFIVIHKSDLNQQKLRHVITSPTKTYFPPRHPVLVEIMNRHFHKMNRAIICEAIRQYFSQ